TQEVFAFVTTPGHWPRWHPQSRGVSGATDHPLTLAEQVTEEILVAGRAGTALWTVRECQAPRRWVIEGAGATGGRAPRAYNFTDEGAGTRFERDLVLQVPGSLDEEALRRHMEAESAEALRRLKAVLEEQPAGGS